MGVGQYQKAKGKDALTRKVKIKPTSQHNNTTKSLKI